MIVLSKKENRVTRMGEVVSARAPHDNKKMALMIISTMKNDSTWISQHKIHHPHEYDVGIMQLPADLQGRNPSWIKSLTLFHVLSQQLISW